MEPNPFQRNASLGQLFDTQQGVQVRGQVMGASLLALRSGEQSFLDVVAHGATRAACQCAEFIEGEGGGSHGVNYTTLKVI